MFEMSDEIVRRISFAMENQDSRYLMDMEKGALVLLDDVERGERPAPRGPVDPAARYQALPEWKSADGFQLMEHFLTELHNPMVRSRLSEILHSGKGVFRRFKDCLREYPEVQRRYHVSKYRYMRTAIMSWYNQFRELSGLDTVELGVDEELDDLVMSNIDIHEVRRVPQAVISELDRQAFYESAKGTPDEIVRYLYRRRRARLPDPGDTHSVVFGAYTATEDLCGFLWATRDSTETAKTIYLMHQVYVLPEHRGLGIGTSLLEYAIRAFRKDRAVAVVARFPGNEDLIDGLLNRNGFSLMQRERVLVF